MGRLTPVFGVLGVMGFAVLHACSSDNGASGGRKPGSGASGGEPGSGGSSGSAGKGGIGGGGSGKGGASGTGGEAGDGKGGAAGDAGAGGQGGEGATGPGETCTACIDHRAARRRARDGFDPPGNEVEQRALGYLHANCGNCHHAGTMHGGTTPARMRLMVGWDTVAATDTCTSLVDVPTLRPFFAGCDRVEPGYASLSEIVMRMSRRDTPQPGQQMPPLGTEVVHTQGVAFVTAWINALPSGSAVPTCVPPM